MGKLVVCRVRIIWRQREKLRKELDEYSMDDIYNADETSLYWAMEPCQVLTDHRLSEKKRIKVKFQYY